MQDLEFHEKVDTLFFYIEDALDNYTGDYDLDYEIHSGILTISFHDNSKIILNKQEPLHQVWMATKFNGHHFAFDKASNKWLCIRAGDDLFDVLTDALCRQSGETFLIK
ncbi:iron donor protein CyaY [Thorsellia kenyensis]|uniref:Iron-sulfur cluster assembly protein CyaY n=1 Tax=Thorsellia kenyensis TaxID=1549888 RepID=A0ABV6CC91_9GAMM